MAYNYCLIKGAGDLASGVACLLNMAGFPVVMTEIPEPTCVRRKVSFAEAVYAGETWVENIKGVLVQGFPEAQDVMNRGEIAVIVDPEGRIGQDYPPEIFIDASMAKKNLGTGLHLGKIVIALGPGFEAGRDAHAVIETQRGPNLGKAIFSGCASPDTGIPGNVLGYTIERLLRAPADGVFREVKSIGDYVEQGEIVAYVDEHPVKAQISGTLRGLLKSGLKVHQGMKAGDIHPEKDKEVVAKVTDKAWTVGMGVLKAILALRKNKDEKRGEKLKIFSSLDQLMQRGRAGMLYTLVDGGGLKELEIGARLFIMPDGKVQGSLGIPALDRDMTKRGEQDPGNRKETTGVVAWKAPWAEAKGDIAGKVIHVLEETVAPQKKLIIFGGGHISLPLAQMAVILGYRVIVVDDREEFANKKRFPWADKTVCADFQDVLKGNMLEEEIDCATSIVIITRGHRQDKTCVRHLAGRDVKYLGMIGSRNKVKQTFTDLLAEGFPKEELEKISAPIGLDLGGQSPAEVALSILAEMVAHEYQGSGEPVKKVKGVVLP
ncbi:MAG: selenium-dependent molybdenum cofactor biosynthesis protein YqeB [Bacillota bacterium]|jgi:xanthine dehydrogenase accessory factor